MSQPKRRREAERLVEDAFGVAESRFKAARVGERARAMSTIPLCMWCEKPHHKESFVPNVAKCRGCEEDPAAQRALTPDQVRFFHATSGSFLFHDVRELFKRGLRKAVESLVDLSPESCDECLLRAYEITATLAEGNKKWDADERHIRLFEIQTKIQQIHATRDEKYAGDEDDYDPDSSSDASDDESSGSDDESDDDEESVLS